MTAMSVQSTAETGRSLLGEVLHWALPRLAGYVLAALGSVVAFTIWAVIYTYVWSAPPPAVVIEPPTPQTTPITGGPPRAAPPISGEGTPVASVPATQAPSSTNAKYPSAISQLPADALSVTQLRKLHVYDLNNERIGEIEDVVFSPDGKIYAYVVGLGGFLGAQGKDIAVPVHAMQFKKTDNSDGYLILHMSKDAVRNAPQFEYGKMKWGEGNWTGVTPPDSPR